jgi:dihydroxyacetone kinase-like protein
MSVTPFSSLLLYVTHVIEAHKDLLCELDGEVGDGDHGVSLTIGMRAARRALQNLVSPTPEQCLVAMSEAFADEVGASSGVIYEAAFASAGRALRGVTAVNDASHWQTLLHALASSVKDTGHASVGDKTMLDAWLPAAEAHQLACKSGRDSVACLTAAVDAAWDGVRNTKDQIPRRGRASLLGERARGHPDAGATSAYLMIRALRDGLAMPEGPGTPISIAQLPSIEDVARGFSPWRPSVLTWQAYAPYLAAGGRLSRVLEELRPLDFFGAVELPCVEDSTQRKRLRQLVQQNGWQAVIWASEIQSREKLHLAAPASADRTRSRERFHQLLNEAAECGASRFGFCSPPTVATEIGSAKEALAEELAKLAREAEKRGITLIFEGLDTNAHKRGLLGNTQELAHLATTVRAEVPGFGLVWDAAHTALNGEDLVTSYCALAPHVLVAHISEAILDRANAEFGDRHLPLGHGSVITPRQISALASAMRREYRGDGAPLFVAAEEWNSDYACNGTQGLRRAWSYLTQHAP